MTDVKCELEGANIVVVGSFNPAIVHPSWLAQHELIRAGEAKTANLQICHPEVTQFELEWLRVQVQRERFDLATQDPAKYGPLRDLAKSIFKVLEHTVIDAVGFNRNFHYRMPEAESWHGIGDGLAPKQTWESVFDGPGLESLVISGTRSTDRDPRSTRVTVQPSKRVVPHGVFISMNDHFELSSGVDELTRTLDQHWDESLSFAGQTATKILKVKSEQD